MGGLTPVLTLHSGLTVPAHLVNQSPTVSHMPPYLFQPPTHQTSSNSSTIPGTPVKSHHCYSSPTTEFDFTTPIPPPC